MGNVSDTPKSDALTPLVKKTVLKNTLASFVGTNTLMQCALASVVSGLAAGGIKYIKLKSEQAVFGPWCEHWSDAITQDPQLLLTMFILHELPLANTECLDVVARALGSMIEFADAVAVAPCSLVSDIHLLDEVHRRCNKIATSLEKFYYYSAVPVLFDGETGTFAPFEAPADTAHADLMQFVDGMRHNTLMKLWELYVANMGSSTDGLNAVEMGKQYFRRLAFSRKAAAGRRRRR